MRPFLFLPLFTLLILLIHGRAEASQANVDLLIERAEAHGAIPSRVLDVASCETGGTFDAWGSIGSLGERGLGQWLPGRAAWRETPTYQAWRFDITNEYARGNPEAVWHDADQLAWGLGPQAPPNFWKNWSCAW